MVLPVPPPVTTTTQQSSAQSSVCLVASVPRGRWTSKECVRIHLSAIVVCPSGTQANLRNKILSPFSHADMCSGGKVWSDCGTACPTTCDNYNTTVVCTLQCVRGCFCPQGKVDLNGVCVNSSMCSGQYLYTIIILCKSFVVIVYSLYSCVF